MKLVKVKIYPNLTASEVEKTINEAIGQAQHMPNMYINYKLMIGNSVRINEYASTVYSLIIEYLEDE